jgi:hypothetical protein
VVKDPDLDRARYIAYLLDFSPDLGVVAPGRWVVTLMEGSMAGYSFFRLERWDGAEKDEVSLCVVSKGQGEPDNRLRGLLFVRLPYSGRGE